MRKNQHISDADLLDLFRLGENDGTVLLYEKYYKGLVYFARQIVDHAGEAEDIVQECMVKLFNRRGDFEELSKIKSFLYVSVRNACLNYLKQQDRQRISQKELLYLTEKGDDTADHEMLKSRVLSEVFIEIAALPDQCRKVFQLLYFNRMSTAEVAASLGISSQTVLNQKARALKLLRYRLSEKGFLVMLFLFKICFSK